MTTESVRTQSDVEFPFPHPAMVGGGQGTVVNSERRGSDATIPMVPDSSTLGRLFPRDDDGVPQLARCEGLRLEHFEIVDRLGQGGMSSVFLARDTRLERLVALKVLAPAQSRDPEAVKRFLNEARAAARLDHPNIVRSLYVGEQDGAHFIVYEYVDGSNLRDVIRRDGRLGVHEAVNYTIQIALALQHASARGVVHRDIKPSNIVVTADGRAKLVDLGLARMPTEPGTDDLTIAGTTLGTFDYVSPEQATDPREVDVRSDIYSLGCTLYHMLTGQPPYPEGTMLKKLLDHERRSTPDPASHNRSVPPALGSLCRRMMASQPRSRPADADVLLHELSIVAAQLGLHATQPEGFVWGTQRRTRSFLANHLGWMTTVGILLLIVFFLDRLPSAGDPPGFDSPDTDNPAVVDGGTRPGAGETAGTDDGDPRTDDGDSGTDSGSPGDGRRDGTDDGTTVPEIGPTELRDPSRTNERSGGGSDTDDPGDSGPPTPMPKPPMPDPGIDKPPTPSVPPVEATDGPAYAIVPTEVDVPARTFKSLAAAVAAAEDGDIVELGFDGERIEKPFRVSGKHVFVRAAAGFHPTVRFVHARDPGAEDVLRMITVTNGAIDLINVDVVLEADPAVPIPSDGRWTLVSLTGSQQAKIRNSTITVRNPGAGAVAIVEVRESSTRPLMPATMMKPSDADGARATVEIANTLVRGNTEVLALERTRPTRIDLENCVFAVEGALLEVLGTTSPGGESDFVDLTANHVTALVGHGLIRFDAGELPRYLPTLHVSANNNLFATRSETALVSHAGRDDLQDFLDLLRWSGGTNYYDGFFVFRTLPPGFTPAEEVDFEGWRRLWNVSTDRGSVTWATPPRETGYVDLEPADLALDGDAAANPAIGGATDDTDVGADLTKVGAPGR